MAESLFWQYNNQPGHRERTVKGDTARRVPSSHFGRTIKVSYRNKTYVIFDADTDMYAYAFMKGWKVNDNVDFNFYDAHDLRPLRDWTSDQTIFSRLRERMCNAKQAIVLIGPYTKNLRKFVPWEIELAKAKQLPIVAVNLNGKREMDPDRCPASLREYPAVHVPFKMKIIKLALDSFPDEFARNFGSWNPVARLYDQQIYAGLGI